MPTVKLSEKHLRLAMRMRNELHKGQKRKGSGIPYWTHPAGVARILKKYGYDDFLHQILANLHDTVEDAHITVKYLADLFGSEVANGVFLLSRNQDEISSDRTQYLQRLARAPETVRRVKIADAIHNTRTLEEIYFEDPEHAERLIKDAEKHYIPWGKKIAPAMVRELIENIRRYLKKQRLECDVPEPMFLNKKIELMQRFFDGDIYLLPFEKMTVRKGNLKTEICFDKVMNCSSRKLQGHAVSILFSYAKTGKYITGDFFPIEKTFFSKLVVAKTSVKAVRES